MVLKSGDNLLRLKNAVILKQIELSSFPNITLVFVGRM